MNTPNINSDTDNSPDANPFDFPMFCIDCNMVQDTVKVYSKDSHTERLECIECNCPDLEDID